MAPKIDVSLHFMPAFYCRHTGVRYGEAYYFDPDCRAAIEGTEARFLYDVLGRYGVGNPHPQPSANLFVQPVDLVMRTQGAQWRFPVDGTLESMGTPWAALSPAEIARIPAADAARHPVMDALLAAFRQLQQRYGDRADLFGARSGTMNVHTPYTTAHQLCGENLFIMMKEDPAAVAVIFAKVWELYEAIFARVAVAIGGTFTRVQLGDCSAALLSAPLYRAVVLPCNRLIAARFARAGYHSCGRSSHLLEAFAGLGPLDAIELGAGTDLATAVRRLPGTAMRPLVDPVLMRDARPEQVQQTIAGMLHDTTPAPAVTLCAWSFDRDTPLANVAALYETVGAHRGSQQPRG